LPHEIVREGWERLAPLERLYETVADIKSDRLKVSALEMIWYMRNQLLRDSDWAGMAHSVEIRTPMIDLSVLRTLVPLLANRPLNGKRELGKVPARQLPEPLINLPKTGFGVPLHEWVSGPGAHPRILSVGLRHWAMRLAREFHFAA
jgi:asparagine synthase (glutamine-hydrolysing)